MKHNAIKLSLSLVLALAALAPARAQGLDRIDRERAQTMLNVIKGEIKKNYYDQSFGGADIDARFKAAEEKLKAVTSFNQALGIVAQALIDFNDSHLFFVPPPRPVSVEYGWEMQAVGERVLITAVRPGSDAARQGLREGDEVLAVDNFRPSRKELWKMDYYYKTLSPRPGVRLTVRSPGGEARQLDAASQVKQGRRILDLFNSQDVNDLIRDIENSGRIMRHRFQKAGGFVVWKLPTFDFEPRQADQLMDEQVAGSGGLILDLRGNGGGRVDTLERLVSHFFDREVKIADVRGRKEMKPQVAKKRSGKPYEGRLVVLIDSESGSASEIFARVMQIEKRGVVIGDRSAGAVMQSRFHSLEMGDTTKLFYGASVTEADVITTDGKSLEHVGVTPDELLLPTPEDLASGRDPVLARAAALLGLQLDPARAGAMFPVEWQR